MIYETNFSRNTMKWSVNKTADSNSKCIGTKAESIIKLDTLGVNVPKSIFLDYSIYNYYFRYQQLPNELEVFFKNKNIAKFVAIRSSSSIEDGIHRSYAGYFLTELNVISEYEQVIQKIVECYHSINKLKTISYRIKRSIKMGIIIQEMILPEYSGIAFTISPENAEENLIQMEYCNGYGDQLTSGQILSSSLKINKIDLKVVFQNGVLTLPKYHRDNVCNYAKQIENYFNFPQDIEFVIEKNTGKLFFLQSRPITAFNFTAEKIIQKESEKIEHIFLTGKQNYNSDPILSVSNIAELFPEAIPLGYSIFQYIFTGNAKVDGAYNLGRKKLGYATIPRKILKNLFVTIGNKARINLQIQALVYRLQSIDEKYYYKHFLTYYFNLLNIDIEKYNYAQNKIYIQNPSLKECIEIFIDKGAEIHAKYSDFIFILLNQTIPQLKNNFQLNLKENEEYYKKLRQNFIELDTGRLSLKDNVTESDIKALLIKIADSLRQGLGVQYVIHVRIAFLSCDIVRIILKRLIELKPELFNLEIELNRHDEIVEYYLNVLLRNEINAQNSDPDDKKRVHNLKDFRRENGHIGPLDLSQPRLGEYNDKDLKKIITNSRQNKNQNNANEIKWVNDFTNWYKNQDNEFHLEMKNLFEWIDNANIFMHYREKLKSELLKILYIVKLLINELSQKHQLNELIHYLTFDDVQRLNDETLNSLRLCALKTRGYYNSCIQVEIDRFLFKNNPTNLKSADSTKEQSGIYRSIPGDTIYHGKAEGICLVANNAFEFHNKISEYKKRGIIDIIGVFKSVEPAYQNIRHLNGIITEFGGQLAHAATICREHNIPYISGVDTADFEDGNYIIFDTTHQNIILRD